MISYDICFMHLFYLFTHYVNVMINPSQVCGASDKDELPAGFMKLARDAYTPDLIAASDCMLGWYNILAAYENS